MLTLSSVRYTHIDAIETDPMFFVSHFVVQSVSQPLINSLTKIQ